MNLKIIVLAVTGLPLVFMPAVCDAQSGVDPNSVQIAKQSTATTEKVDSSAQRRPNDPQTDDEKLAADQPWMASGVDLMGPPQRFPAGKTPGHSDLKAH
jgi:hypothetical protein